MVRSCLGGWSYGISSYDNRICSPAAVVVPASRPRCVAGGGSASGPLEVALHRHGLYCCRVVCCPDCFLDRYTLFSRRIRTLCCLESGTLSANDGTLASCTLAKQYEGQVDFLYLYVADKKNQAALVRLGFVATPHFFLPKADWLFIGSARMMQSWRPPCRHESPCK